MKNNYRVEGDTAIVEIVRRSGEVFECLIDVDTLERLKAEKISLSIHSEGYVQFKKDKKHNLLHRWILNEPEFHVDHINGNRLDNRKANLREVTNKQNHRNPNNKALRGAYNGISEVKGRKKKWRYRRFGKTIAYFYTREEAKAFKDKYEQEIFKKMS